MMEGNGPGAVVAARGLTPALGRSKMSTQSTRGKVSRQCQQCGAGFMAHAADVARGGGKFCSHLCYLDDKRAKSKNVATACNICGKAMVIGNRELKRNWGRFCSNECRAVGRITQTEITCATCKKVFKVVASRSATVQTCSRACHFAHLRTLPVASPEERFWEKVKKVGECWHWTGAKSETGYGLLAKTKRDHPGRGKSKVFFAHRLSYELHNGPAAGMQVCHRCDNPICVNPVHLFLGTHADNMMDKTIKGRAAKKLTADDVRSIRTRYENSEASQRGLASEFGVSVTCIINVLKRKTFKHVD